MGKQKETMKIYKEEFGHKIHQKKYESPVDHQETEIETEITSQQTYYTPLKKNLLQGRKHYEKEDNQFLEEKKFDEEDYKDLKGEKNYINYSSRKGSRDSDTESTSNEEKNEKEKENVSKPSYQSKKNFNKNNNKSEFKGTATDFKVKYKTEECKYFKCYGYCKYGDKCAFAHGKNELRPKVTNTTAFRTKDCEQFFKYGYCPYGSRCQFRHQLRSNIINNPYDTTLMTYSKILDTISKLENIQNLKMLVEKPRLKVFTELTKNDNDENNDENIPSRLFNDLKELADSTKK